MRIKLAIWLLRGTKYHVVRKYNSRKIIAVPKIESVTTEELTK